MTAETVKRMSPQQRAVVEWVRDGRGSAFVEAVAGAGKTTTLIAAVRETTGFVNFCAYNKKIADEIKGKIAKLNLGNRVRVGTFHSFGLGAWRRVYPNVKIDERGKSDKIALELGLTAPWGHPHPPDSGLRPFVEKLISLAKQRAIGLYGAIDDQSLWYDIVEHFDLAYEIEDEASIQRGIELAIQGLRRHIELAKEIVDFDDMIYMPVTSGIRVWENDWVMTDEAQDTNPARRALVRKMLKPNGRALFVGDRCQPAGTLITIPDGRIKGGQIATRQVRIETLKVGDTVVSFSRRYSSFVQSGRKVKGITKKLFKGKIITIKSQEKSTHYTPNHFCYVKIKPVANKYSVYLMQKEDLWRIGTSLVQNGHGVCGPMIRKRIEKADNVWVLELFNTEREAKTYEFKIATEYGIPELLFKAPGSTLNPYWENTQKSINLAWASLDKNKLFLAAKQALLDHGRDLNYPFNETASKPGEFWVTRPIKMRACNIMTGMSVLHYNGVSHYSKDNFYPAVVSINDFKGFVYSLNVDTDHSYVADNIATFNCQAIYAFQGADNDAVDQIVSQFKCVVLPLTVTFRCPKAVVQVAREIVDHIEAHETAPEGVVRTINVAEMEAKAMLASYHPTDDAILCRKTKPLVEMAYRFIRHGVACHVEGRDIGAGLLKLVNRFSARTLAVLEDKLKLYAEREVAKLMAKGKETQAEALQDRVDTVLVITDTCKDVGELRQKIADLFQDANNEVKPTVTMATVHKSKGREWKRVFVLGYNQYMPSPYARQQWCLAQERNLQYVAITRAQHELVFVDVEA